MKALYVGRTYHKNKTRSSDFMIELLKERYEVVEHYPEEDDISSFETSLEQVDFVVTWQHEPVALLALHYQKPCIIMPMYDGVSTLSLNFWSCLRPCFFVNFSKTLHKFLQEHEFNSMAVQYYPDPEKFEPVDDFDTLRLFYWERRPDYLDHKQLVEQTQGKVEKYQIHIAPDTAPPESVKRLDSNIVSYSTWGSDKNSYFNSIRASNIYVAPRPAEGIGFSFLEALASGMCVVANDMPTMNEYIFHGQSGYLIRDNNFRQLNFDKEHVRLVAHNARKSVVEGHSHWLRAYPQMFDRIETYVRQFKASSWTIDDNLVRAVRENFGKVDYCIDIMNRN